MHILTVYKQRECEEAEVEWTEKKWRKVVNKKTTLNK